MQNQEQIFKLVAIGALEPGKYDLESICLTLIEFLETRYKGCIAKALGIKIEWPCNLEFIAKEKNLYFPMGLWIPSGQHVLCWINLEAVNLVLLH